MRYKRILIITAIAVFWFSIANLPTISAMGSDDSSLTCDFIAGNWDFTETMRHCKGFIGGGDYSMVITNDCSYTTPGGTLSGVWTISGHTISTTFDDPFGQCGLYTWIATVSCNEMYGTISSTGGSSGTLYFQRTSEPPEVAGFTADLNSGLAPLTVNFTDQSTGDITSWSWDFGDGASSTEQNPSHTYTDAGTYTVSLAVTGPCGPDTKTKKNYISVFEDYDFTIEPSQGTIGTEVEVNITNSSSLWEKAPKVLIGETKCKVTTFTPTSVSCLLKKIKNTNPPGTYDVTIIRKGKGVQPIVLPSAFSIMAPEIQNIEPDIGEAEEEVTIFGSFFGTKKVKAYMDDGINKKKCKVTSLTMVSTTGESELKILVPKKGLLPGQCDVTVTNKVGEDTLVGGFTIQ
jgi:PKD repeat protein